MSLDRKMYRILFIKQEKRKQSWGHSTIETVMYRHTRYRCGG